MQDEETDLSFADVNTSSAPKRPYTAPLLKDDPDNENAPDLAAEGVHLIWSTRPGSLASCARDALAERSSAANRRPPRWQGDAGVDFIEFFAESGHIGSFRSIVGEAWARRKITREGLYK